MEGMFSYTKPQWSERCRIQEVILPARAKKITHWQAAEIIIGLSDRQMRRWRERYDQFGFRGAIPLEDARTRPSYELRVYLGVLEK